MTTEPTQDVDLLLDLAVVETGGKWYPRASIRTRERQLDVIGIAMIMLTRMAIEAGSPTDEQLDEWIENIRRIAVEKRPGISDDFTMITFDA